MSQVDVSIPGKVMLAGEYAVLEGGACLAAAVDLYMHITARTRHDQYLVYSDLWQQAFHLNEVPAYLEANPLIQTLRWAVRHWNLPAFEISLSSEFQVSDGFGSSSALRIGCLAALSRLFQDYVPVLENKNDPWFIPRTAWQMQLAEQSFASGYDVMTQWLGGFLSFQSRPEDWPGTTRHVIQANTGASDILWVMRGGQGAPTSTVGKETKKWLKQNQLWPSLLERSQKLVEALTKCLTAGPCDISKVVTLASFHRQLFEASPMYPSTLLKPLLGLEGCDSKWSFKTTGAGGEDALLLIGSKPDVEPAINYLAQKGWSQLTASLGGPGLHIHEQSNPMSHKKGL